MEFLEEGGFPVYIIICKNSSSSKFLPKLWTTINPASFDPLCEFIGRSHVASQTCLCLMRDCYACRTHLLKLHPHLLADARIPVVTLVKVLKIPFWIHVNTPQKHTRKRAHIISLPSPQDLYICLWGSSSASLNGRLEWAGNRDFFVLPWANSVGILIWTCLEHKNLLQREMFVSWQQKKSCRTTLDQKKK